VIDRSTTSDTPFFRLAFYKAANVFGTHVAETILASVHVRAQQQAGRMHASDWIKIIYKYLVSRGPSTYAEELQIVAHLSPSVSTG